jgi:flagellar biosynthesis component FlhA
MGGGGGEVQQELSFEEEEEEEKGALQQDSGTAAWQGQQQQEQEHRPLQQQQQQQQREQQGQQQQYAEPALIEEMVGEGARHVLAAEASGQLQGRYPYMYAAAEDLALVGGVKRVEDCSGAGSLVSALGHL